MSLRKEQPKHSVPKNQEKPNYLLRIKSHYFDRRRRRASFEERYLTTGIDYLRYTMPKAGLCQRERIEHKFTPSHASSSVRVERADSTHPKILA